MSDLSTSLLRDGLLQATTTRHEEMMVEARRIVDAGNDRDLVLRLTGGLAVRHYAIDLEFAERDYSDIGQRTADLVSACRPTLTVVDAVRILTANGPTGGDLSDVEKLDTVIASPDIVAADSYAATLFDLSGADIPYVQAAYDMGLGEMDLDKVDVRRVSA